MSERGEFELLEEIARLLTKYGPETFAALAKELSSPAFSEQLATVLAAVAEAGRQAQSQQTHRPEAPSGAAKLRSLLIDLEKSEPEKARLLLGFHDDLMGKRLLPAVRDLQVFTVGIDPASPPPTGRKKLVESLIRQLLPMPAEKVRAIIASVQLMSPEDRSLAGWTKLILDRDLSKKKAE